MTRCPATQPGTGMPCTGPAEHTSNPDDPYGHAWAIPGPIVRVEMQEPWPAGDELAAPCSTPTRPGTGKTGGMTPKHPDYVPVVLNDDWTKVIGEATEFNPRNGKLTIQITDPDVREALVTTESFGISMKIRAIPKRPREYTGPRAMPDREPGNGPT